MAGLGVRLSLAVFTTVASLLVAPAALGAVSFPRSISPSASCVLPSVIDTNSFPGAVFDPGETDPNVPEVLVVSCTSITVPSGGTRVTGPRALELRATGDATITGILDVSGDHAAQNTPGNSGPGGLSGGPSAGFAGGNGSPTLPGAPGSAGLNSGGSYSSGSDATPGDPGPASDYGGGGGGAGRSALADGSRGLTSTQVARMRGGTRGGQGGNSNDPTPPSSLGGAGGGGGGAVRIIAEGQISIASGGGIDATGGRGGAPTQTTAPRGGSGGGGSGGVIDLIAPAISVAGIVDARGGPRGEDLNMPAGARGGSGGDGRIRILANDDPGGGFPAREYVGEHSVTIDAAVSGPGSGTITSQPAGIDCPSDCTEPFDPDTSLTVTASPAAGSTLSGWGADCAPAGSAASCNVLLDDADADNRFAANAAFGLVPTESSPPPSSPQPPAGKGRPDLVIGRAGKSMGDDVYGTNGAGQSAKAKLAPGDRASFAVELENDGDAADGMIVGAPKGTGGFKLKYTFAGRTVTKEITGAGLAVGDLAPGENRTLTATAKAARRAEPGSRQKFLVLGRSAGDPTFADAVRMKLRVPNR